MGHLMDQQRALGIHEVNYGPEIDVADIRRTMPEAMILGHMPPTLLRNAAPEAIEARVISDFEKAGPGGGCMSPPRVRFPPGPGWGACDG